MRQGRSACRRQEVFIGRGLLDGRNALENLHADSGSLPVTRPYGLLEPARLRARHLYFLLTVPMPRAPPRRKRPFSRLPRFCFLPFFLLMQSHATTTDLYTQIHFLR